MSCPRRPLARSSGALWPRPCRSRKAGRSCRVFQSLEGNSSVNHCHIGKDRSGRVPYYLRLVIRGKERVATFGWQGVRYHRVRHKLYRLLAAPIVSSFFFFALHVRLGLKLPKGGNGYHSTPATILVLVRHHISLISQWAREGERVKHDHATPWQHHIAPRGGTVLPKPRGSFEYSVHHEIFTIISAGPLPTKGRGWLKYTKIYLFPRTQAADSTTKKHQKITN